MRRIALAACFVGGMWACQGATTNIDACLVGEKTPCVGAGECSGTHVCNADHTYGECVCQAVSGDPDAASDDGSAPPPGDGGGGDALVSDTGPPGDAAPPSDAAPPADASSDAPPDVLSTWTPASLGTLALWLDAAKGLTLTGQSVTTWADQSGKGNDVTFAGTSTQTGPTVHAAAFGALPALEWGATSGPMSRTTFVLPACSYTMYIVVATAKKTYAFLPLYTNSGVLGLNPPPSTPDRAFGEVQPVAGAPIGFVSSSAGFTDGKPHLLGLNLSLANGFCTGELRGDGAGQASGATASAVAAVKAVYVAGGNYQGLIAEIIATTAPLAGTDQASAEAYFKAKYGIP